MRLQRAKTGSIACATGALLLVAVAACGGAATNGTSPEMGTGATDAGMTRHSSPTSDASPSVEGGVHTGGADAGGASDANIPPDGGGPGHDASQTSGDAGSASGVLTASPMFGFSESSTQAASWPDVSYGMQRFWDSPPDQWPSLNPAAGVFDFTNLDADLALAYQKGTLEGFYTLARTPPWATSKPDDTSCHYTTGEGGGNGECDAPSDLALDGSGTNAIWKAWITAIATHVNAPGYTSTHAHIRYWEIWNEPDTQAYWGGSIAQLARLVEDANCIITGRGVIHENGDGTATQCTATAIDPTAKIVMPSAHAKTVALMYGQNELYCSAESMASAYQLPCANPPNAMSAAVDIINFHMKPGNEMGNTCPAPTACTAESAMAMYVSNIKGILSPEDLAKPLWNGEAQYSTSGFAGDYTDPDLAASFMPRFYLTSWSLGITGTAWYSEPQAPSTVNPSLQQTIDWMVGASLTSKCTASGTLWSCGLTKAGKDLLVMWDTSQTCTSGMCTTGAQTVANEWTTYQDMTAASTPVTITSHSVPVGIKPLVLAR